MPLIYVGAYGTDRYGDFGYGGDYIISGGGVFAGGCSPALRDPNGIFWALGVEDDGTISITSISLNSQIINGPILVSAGNRSQWQLSLDGIDSIVTTLITPQTIQRAMDYIPLVSSGGFVWLMGVDDDGSLTTTSSNTLPPDIIPYIPDVSMSVFGMPPTVTCPMCGNATITVSADLSCWCCTCSSFILPEDTTITVILSE